jgi:YfiH family protein
VTLPGAEALGPVRLIVTDRRGGVSRPPWNSLNLADHVGDDPAAVAENRRRTATSLAVSQVSVIDADHGSTVHRVQAAGRAPKGDALVTTRPGLGLLALSADCVAGAIAAPDLPAAGVLHCGWRGLAAGVVPATVAAMVRLGADPARLLVRLGPAICPDCYEVSSEVRDRVAAVVPRSRSATASGAPAIDLVGGAVTQLHDAGVRTVGVDGRCTAEDPALYSHRRDGLTGRQAILAVLEGDA